MKTFEDVNSINENTTAALKQSLESNEETQRALWVEWRKDMLSMVALIERTYGMRRSIRCPQCGHKID